MEGDRGEEMITLPEMMKKVGYKTAAIGTWHSKVEQIPGETARRMGFGYSGSEADIGLSDYSIYEAVDFISRQKKEPFSCIMVWEEKLFLLFMRR